MYKYIMTVILILTISGCGGSSKKSAQPNETILDTTAKRYFGILSNASVNIYELGEGEKRLLFSETTSSGQTVKESGNFNPHFDALDPNKYYLYEIKGGENIDIDKDGVVDETPSTNRKVYSAVYKGHKLHVAYRELKTTNTTVGSSEKQK